MDVARRYVKNTVLGVAVLLFLCVIVGILAKLYEVSGLKDWKRRHLNSDADDGQLDGGSARRLLAAESDLGGTTTDDEQDREPFTNGKGSSSNSGAVSRKLETPLMLRRQHSNSDSESTTTNTFNQISTQTLSRTRSDMKRTEEQQRRARTLSESGVIVSRASNTQQISDSSLSMSRQSSNPYHRTTRTALAELQKSISESSSQQDNFSVPSDPLMATSASLANSEPRIGEGEDRSRHSAAAGNLGIAAGSKGDAKPLLSGLGTGLSKHSTHSSSSTGGGRTHKRRSDSDSKRPRKRWGWVRALLVLIILSISVTGFLIVGCIESWLDPAVCSGMSLLEKVVDIYCFDLAKMWDDVVFGEGNAPAPVGKAGVPHTGASPIGMSLPVLSMIVMRQVLRSTLGSPIVAGVVFVMLISCLVLCGKGRSGQEQQRVTKGHSTSSSSQVPVPTNNSNGESVGKKRPVPAPIRLSPSSHEETSIFFDAPPLASPVSTVSRRSTSSPEYVSNLIAKLEKIGGFSCFRSDPNGVELPSLTLTKNLIQQSAVFCLLITDDSFERPNCVDELRFALDLKPKPYIVIIALDRAMDCPLNDQLRKLLDEAPMSAHLTWPGALLSKRNSSLGVFEDERRPMNILCDCIRKAKAKQRFAVFDVFISHFQRSSTGMHPSSTVPTPTMTRSPFSSSSLGAGIVPALGSIVSKVGDATSVAAAVALINAMIAGKTLGAAEGAALLAVLHNKEHEEQARLEELMERKSSEHSVVEVPQSPRSFFRETRTSASEGGDDDDTSDEPLMATAQASSNGLHHQYRYMTTEIARKTTQQQHLRQDDDGAEGEEESE